jgi:hypothetical protein
MSSEPEKLQIEAAKTMSAIEFYIPRATHS